MAAQVLGGGLHADVCAQVEGLLQQRGHEGVIDDHDCAVAVRDFGDGGNVAHAQ